MLDTEYISKVNFKMFPVAGLKVEVLDRRDQRKNPATADMPLVRLEVFNFKSYRSVYTLETRRN